MAGLQGYTLEKRLHQGKSIVYRGVRRSDGAPVIIKMLRGDFPTPRQIAVARREFEILQKLSCPGVVQPIELVPLDNGPAIVMEDFGAVSLGSRIGGGLDLEVFLQLGISLAHTLGQIHQRGVVHKDIKPANLVVHPETQEIKFIDFSISSQIAREAQTAQGMNVFEGSLRYISPEQTGRMNRQVDFRSDFYSLGVTFYEMLCGHTPFEAKDPIELVHHHIARAPTPLHERAPRVPAAVSAIVMRLLAKTPEERYQSAFGLEADLRRCQEELRAGRPLGAFELGQRDAAEALQISQRLYSREGELGALLGAFERAAEGRTELMLVAGQPGIGKSALVHEVEKPIARSRGYFIEGKSDQFKRNIPYASVIQAFRGLMGQLLTEGEERVQSWRERLREALGPSGRIITDVIPEVELLVGEQPPVDALGPGETQFRFNRIFRRFIDVFARPEHPLALFLDDLQWADLASLALLEVLVTDPDSRSLFVIGAYRDNEVDDSHPLRATLRAAGKAGARVSEITLSPLSRADVGRLVADSLREDSRRVAPLVDLVLEKTDGNPFFVNEFLLSLRDEGLLSRAQGAWTWDIERIHRRAMTNNVVELMAGKLKRLDGSRVVELAACVGGVFELSMLAVVNEKSPAETARELWPAVEQGLVLPLSEGYKFLLTYEGDELPPEAADVGFKFLHDRVQQAAYSLIAADLRTELHLRIGRLLLDSRPEPGDLLFDVVGHLNQATALISSPAERLRLAELNLQAGKKAAASTAYAPALAYLETGAGMLPADAFEGRYELAFELHLELSRCLFLTSQYDRAEAALGELLGRARSNVDRVKVNIIQISLYQTRGNIDGVLRLAIEGANRLGLSIPEAPGEGDVPAEMARIAELVGERDVDSLSELPPMTDPEKLSVMSLVAFMGPAAYLAIQSRPGLWQLVVLKSVRYSLEHGHSPFGVYGYCCYGMILGPGMGQYEAAHKWGRLAVRIAERAGDRTYLCIGTYLHGAFLDTWINHLDSSMELAERAFQLGMDAGNLMWCSLTHSHVGMTPPQRGEPLEQVLAAEQRCLAFAERLQAADIARYYRVLSQWARALMGKTRGPVELSDDRFDEEAFFREFDATGFKIPLHTSHLAKLQLGLFFRRFDVARRHYEASKPIVGGSFGLFQTLEHFFYGALAVTGDLAPGGEAAAAALEEIKDAREKLAAWARSGPANAGPRRLLVEAEAARIEGRAQEATDLYEQSAEAARAGRFHHIHGLACELGGRHQLSLGRSRFARALLAEARHAYQMWGASAKVEHLEEEFQPLLGTTSDADPLSSHHATQSSTTRTVQQMIDVGTVLKASQAISGEIVLDRLLATVMATVIENAGAQRGLLLLSRDGRLFLEAERSIDGEGGRLAEALPLEGCDRLSQAIVQYVARTREPVVLDDARSDPRYARDPYVAREMPRSLLCAPILHQGKLVGALYLENNGVTGAFTPERLQLLRMLSAQAAIAIENARLYGRLERYSHELEEKVEERTHQLQERNGQLAATLQQVVEWQQRLENELAEAVAFVRSLLPPPIEAPLRIDWRFVPSAELGGDGFGYMPLDDDHFAVYLLDICGHGIASALFSISVMTTLSARRLPDTNFHDPASVLGALNRAFPSSSYGERFFTLWYGVYSRSRRELSFASAGHPPAVLLPGDRPGAPWKELGTDGLMIGVLPEATFETASHPVQPGDRLFVFSDGAYEVLQPDGRLLDPDHFMRELTRGGEGSLDRMIRFAYDARGQEGLDDDFSMVEVRFS